MAPLISVCIPAYNRAALLSPLLDSIFDQGFDEIEVVICEDGSPEREQIARVAGGYSARYPGKLRYVENEKNLGYDGNLRQLISLASGEYALFMGNDDLMCPGSLRAVADAVRRHDDVGVVLRSYAAFDDNPANVVQEFRYFDRELYFQPGADSIATVFRRSVVISGVVVHRASAAAVATDRFDGILLYQLYLVARILRDRGAVFLPQILTLYRNGGTPDFGNAEAERGKFVPNEHTPESSVHFMRGMLEIARYVQEVDHVEIYERIVRDIGNYAYPILAIQHDKRLPVFWRYYRDLGKIGLDRVPAFHLYFLSLLLLGPRINEQAIRIVKARLGHTPALGNVYRGRPV